MIPRTLQDILVTLLLSLHGIVNAARPLMVCYYTATSYFPVSQVPANVCTHIIYAFGRVDVEGIQPQSPGDLQNYRTLVQLKKTNPSLKILLSLQNGFPSVVGADQGTVKRFSQSAVKFLADNGFDGVDLDWEYPTASDKNSYKTFIEILRKEIVGAKMLLSAALPNNPSYFTGYDVNCLSSNMDFMTVMAYDFHLFTKKDTTTGYNSPLYTPKGESQYLSASALVTYFLKVGLPSGQLLLGIPLYGRSWTLAQASSHDLHSPAIGKGSPGPYRHFKGLYLYPDACVALQRGANSVLDATNGAAYLYANTTWVAYETIDTIKLKVAWMKSVSLGGVGVWALHLDDNAGVCRAGLFPLLNAIKSNLGI
ncbi:unnamed protein product [Candidula unifasciata]|uniref:GH18 domain-containing protein n=1 Tax=Candidula unifasciata TaxID=100452 RepID=A0A8S3Z9W9_9EUPU|nr:unnamed protein product [Candidula unifasciata]